MSAWHSFWWGFLGGASVELVHVLWLSYRHFHPRHGLENCSPLEHAQVCLAPRVQIGTCRYCGLSGSLLSFCSDTEHATPCCRECCDKKRWKFGD
jgi:hypothetical protein